MRGARNVGTVLATAAHTRKHWRPDLRPKRNVGAVLLGATRKRHTNQRSWHIADIGPSVPSARPWNRRRSHRVAELVGRVGDLIVLE